MLGKHSPQHGLLTLACPLCSQVEMYTLQHIPMFVCLIFFPLLCHQMPGSSGTTQSMKKTIGHRGVETTTGETTYKKVSIWGGVFFDTHNKAEAKVKGSKRVCCLYSKISLGILFTSFLRIVSESTSRRVKMTCLLFSPVSSL